MCVSFVDAARVQGLMDANCTGLCQPGYYCVLGETRRNEHPCGGPDVYCPEGSYEPTPVSIGYYTTGYPLLGTG